MGSKHAKRLLFGLCLLVGSLLIGCAGMGYAPQRGVLYVHQELLDADQALAQARQAGKAAACPDEFNAAQSLRDKAYETYWKCRTQEAITMAKEVIAKVNALCPAKPTPVVRAAPLDSDGDGVTDDLDQCPDTPGGVAVDAQGCPLDSDKDGVADYQDQCPDTPEGFAVDAAGCPTDSDKDGIADYLDQCPNTPAGIPVNDTGCFTRPSLRIFFDTNRAEVKPEYMPEIEKFAQFLQQHPIVKVEIQGNTDSRASSRYNEDLSRRRAEAVQKIFVEQYNIDPKRITVKWFGETNPIASNDTAEGKAKNRRVDVLTSLF
ncbi:MAG: hypothetical protein D6736_06440 [Nitrospinota bacterium]|nr:MAG: hypothetical protein D6736_06440 [Nitrospinota bacterium]